MKAKELLYVKSHQICHIFIPLAAQFPVELITRVDTVCTG